jgi:sigma-B regulation protein RsbU (phosphoserine phosphatase)
MASVRAALRAQIDNVYYLYEVIRRVNIMLCRDTKESEFVTLFYGVYNAKTKRLTYCNAGHGPPMVLRDGKIIELASDNLVLGINPDEAYQQNFIDLQSGDTLLIFTDGVTDAANFKKERFGKARLIQALQAGGSSAEIVAQHVLWELRKFVGMASRTDDVTMIAARVL